MNYLISFHILLNRDVVQLRFFFQNAKSQLMNFQLINKNAFQ